MVAKPSERSQRVALGRRLKPHRKALRLRQADAARILRVSEFTYRNWEQGLYPPPACYVARLLAFLERRS
jgi:DNA-binding transcriptional regulator YiaG